MAFRLAYLILARVLSWLALLARSDATKAWLALAVMAHNLGRAVGVLAGMGRATAATLRRRLFTIPGRLVHTARRLHLRLSTKWPWADAFLTALSRTNALPMRS